MAPRPNDSAKLATVAECQSVVLDVDEPQGPGHFHEEVALLVVQGRPAEAGDRLGPVYGGTTGVRGDEAGVTRILQASCDTVERPFPVNLLPVRSAGGAIEWFREAPGVIRRKLAQGGALGTGCPAVDGMVRVALDVDDLAVLVRHDDKATAGCIVRADGGSFTPLLFKWDLFDGCAEGDTIGEGSEQEYSPNSDAGDFEKFPPVQFHAPSLRYQLSFWNGKRGIESPPPAGTYIPALLMCQASIHTFQGARQPLFSKLPLIILDIVRVIIVFFTGTTTLAETTTYSGAK